MKFSTWHDKNDTMRGAYHRLFYNIGTRDFLNDDGKT